MSIPPLTIVLISDGTNTGAAERGDGGIGSRYVRGRENAAPAFLPSGKGHGETACHGCFWMNGYRLAPSDLGPALTRGIPVQVVMARSPYRCPLSYGGSSADVIQLPDIRTIPGTF